MPLTIVCSSTVNLVKGQGMIRHKNLRIEDVVQLTRDKGDDNSSQNYGEIFWDNRGLGWMSVKSSNHQDTGRIRWTLLR